MRLPYIIALSILSLTTACSQPENGEKSHNAAAQNPADLIFVGTIYTGEGDKVVEAIAIDDGRIVFAGDHHGAHPFHGETTKEIELGNAVAFPGFTDGHAHLTGIGLREMTLNLEGTESVADLQKRVAAEISLRQPGDMIYGRGWIETGWPEARFPTRDDLDEVSSENPVLVERADGHAMLANSIALELAGIDDQTTDPVGGRIERDANGRATGLLIDRAQNLVYPLLGELTMERRTEALKKGGEVYAKYGWTGIYNVSVHWDDVTAMTELSNKGELGLRISNAVEPEFLENLSEWGPQVNANGRITTRAVKLYVDGALGSRGAALKAPYSDQPETSGLVLMTPEQALGYMTEARSADIQVATHAIGDRGNELVLGWYEQVLAGSTDNPRWRIEHAQIVDPVDIPRFAAHNIIASMQPSHAIGDFHFAPDRLGEERLKGAYAWKTLMDSGAIVIGGSDAPVERGDPMIEFYAAVARRDLKGFQGDNWHPEEALSRVDALKIFTSNAAYGAFQEDEVGMLTVGRKADISVFSADIMKIAEAEIPKTKAVMTVVDGNIIFDGR